MVLGIASPNPSGIPGFNEAYGLVAGVGGGALNARPLPSWYNVITNVINTNDSMALPPAAWAMEIAVANNGGNTCVIFGNINPQGTQDTIAGSTGVQGTTGVAIPNNAVGLFWVLTPQRGRSSGPGMPGTWQYKILA